MPEEDEKTATRMQSHDPRSEHRYAHREERDVQRHNDVSIIIYLHDYH